MLEQDQDADLNAALDETTEKAALVINSSRIIQDLVRVSGVYRTRLSFLRKRVAELEGKAVAAAVEMEKQRITLQDEIDRLRPLADAFIQQNHVSP